MLQNGECERLNGRIESHLGRETAGRHALVFLKLMVFQTWM